MMFEDNVLESDELALEELENPQSVPGSLHEPNGESRKERGAGSLATGKPCRQAARIP